MKSIKVRLTRLNQRCPVKSPEILVKSPEMLSFVTRILLGVLHTETEVNKEYVYNISRSLHHLETKQIARKKGISELTVTFLTMGC